MERPLLSPICTQGAVQYFYCSKGLEGIKKKLADRICQYCSKEFRYPCKLREHLKRNNLCSQKVTDCPRKVFDCPRAEEEMTDFPREVSDCSRKVSDCPREITSFDLRSSGEKASHDSLYNNPLL